ncbi:uncharacterized protein LOC124169128 [Ischnura elegans]|uniref:uncharacterized protein LOC124169128 n=1 Tax=Ischnura elegans TaxID=197161 RepID=UPI001ED876CE|nr:uncharacterized protein LOC124169128 [Ischnura elegans]
MRDDPKWNIQFVKVVEKYPVLYDAGNEGHCVKESVEEAWRKVASAMRESVFNCKDKWRNLRTSLTRHLRNRNEPSALSGKYRRPYYMAPYMSFLIPYTKSRTYRPELPAGEMNRRSSMDSSFERRCLERGGDSSSYDNSFGAILCEDKPRPQQPLHHQETARPQEHERARRVSGAGVQRTGDLQPEGGAQRVQPKMEEPEEGAGGERSGAEGDHGGREDDMLEDEEDEEGYDYADDEHVVAEEWEAGGGGGRKRRRLIIDTTLDEHPNTESVGLDGTAAGSDKSGGNPATPGSSRTHGNTAMTTTGPKPGRALGESNDAVHTRELDEDSWSGWLRDGDLDTCFAEERRAAGKSSRGLSRSRFSTAGLHDGRSVHVATEPSNPDMDFFKSILSDVNSLSPSQRSKFRLSILKTLHEMLYDEQ